MDKKLSMRQRTAIVIATLTSIFALGGGAAFADTSSTDPTAGSGDSLFSTLTSYMTTHLVPLVIGLAVVGIAVGMLVKWGKKAAKSA